MCARIQPNVSEPYVPALSIVVPVYQAENTLEEFHSRLTNALRDYPSPVEIILVDDFSRDQSWTLIQNLMERDHRVRGFRLGRNFGQHNALLCGIRAARHPVTVTLDDDLQNPPEEIPTLLAKLSEGHDVVYGAPEVGQHGMVRNQASQLTKIALRGVMGAETARYVSSFRALRTDVRNAFSAYSNPFVSIDVLLTYGTGRFAHTTVRHDPRLAGRSNYTFRMLFAHAVNMITGFTTLPLRLASLVGLAFSLLGALVLIYVVANFIVYGVAVPGFAFLASAIAVFSGVQLFALGIVGEYLGRIHERTMSRPPYQVSEHVELAAVGPLDRAHETNRDSQGAAAGNDVLGLPVPGRDSREEPGWLRQPH
jgi:undecaprenyl-phosphate 4-deoxy-4-formamido-L-arabinose transferase